MEESSSNKKPELKDKSSNSPKNFDVDLDVNINMYIYFSMNNLNKSDDWLTNIIAIALLTGNWENIIIAF